MIEYDPMERLMEFHLAFDVPAISDVDDKDAVFAIRKRLISEEFEEVIDAIDRRNYNDIAHELADLLVVVYGTAEVLGIPLPAVFDEVMRANMSKLDDNGQPVLREDGKVLKGPNYRPPDIAGVLAKE